MEKSRINYGRMASAIVVVSVFSCSIVWSNPYTAKGKVKAASTTTEIAKVAKPAAAMTEESQLIQQLESDGLISQIKGFVVEKKRDVLVINGVLQSASTAGKYISTIKKSELRVEVYPFVERLRQHPDAGFMQVLMPVMLSSPCVDTKPKKPGC